MVPAADVVAGDGVGLPEADADVLPAVDVPRLSSADDVDDSVTPDIDVGAARIEVDGASTVDATLDVEVSDGGSSGDVGADGDGLGAGDATPVEEIEEGCVASGPSEPLTPGETWSTEVALPAGGECTLEVILSADTVWEVVVAGGAEVALTSPAETEPGWRRPTLTEAGTHVVQVANQAGAASEVTVSLIGHGAPPGPLEDARSLVWTTAPMTEWTSLAQLMAVVSEDGHGGALLKQWFERFASTAHSERLGPLLLLQAYEAVLGVDPSTWDLSLLPFHVTGVHNRMDLADGTHCGELRVSLASHDPTYTPLHLIFLFYQPPAPDDVSPNGAVHCTGTALRWARLSELDDDATFEVAAKAWLDAVWVPESFGLIETVEFIVSPWEWRQWFLEDGALDNRPLFQTVDIPTLNAPGPLRESFLAWVAEEAEALATRRAVIPEEFRTPSARAAQGIPWVPLDLSGVSDDILETWPELRQQIELVGCPGCHTADAEFLQTDEDGSLSNFYTKELGARAGHLESHWFGGPAEPPFGPLQIGPIAHP